jgi:hypothetical protein
MKHPLLLAVLAAVVAGSVALVWASRAESPRELGAKEIRSPVAVTDRTTSALRLDPETRKSLGAFRLRKGRKIELATTRAENGLSCLIDEDETGASGGTCLENGLFGSHKVAFSVSSQGGPERFDELYVAGVAEPSVHAIALVKTDGGVVQLGLNAQRAFVFESTLSDLEARVYPTTLRLYGQNGKLVEAVTFPPAG